MLGTVGESVRELVASGDWKEAVGAVVTTAIGWGIAKAVAYLGWGRRAIKKEVEEKEAGKERWQQHLKELNPEKTPNSSEIKTEIAEDGGVAEVIQEAEEVLPEIGKADQEKIEKLKAGLENKYGEDAAK